MAHTKKAFTLIEIVLAVLIIFIISSMIIVEIRPIEQTEKTLDARLTIFETLS